MGEIDRAVLDQWKAVTRAWLLAESEASVPPAHVAEDPPELHCRRSRDRFLSQARQRLFLLMREAGRPEGNALHRLGRVFESHVSFIARHPDMPRRILGWSLQCSDARLRRRAQKVVLHYEFRLSRLIARGQQQGCIRASADTVSCCDRLLLRRRVWIEHCQRRRAGRSPAQAGRCEIRASSCG